MQIQHLNYLYFRKSWDCTTNVRIQPDLWPKFRWDIKVWISLKLFHYECISRQLNIQILEIVWNDFYFFLFPVTSTSSMVNPPMKLSKSGNYYTENKEKNLHQCTAARKLQPSLPKFECYSVAQPVKSTNIAQYSVVHLHQLFNLDNLDNKIMRLWGCLYFYTA